MRPAAIFVVTLLVCAAITYFLVGDRKPPTSRPAPKAAPKIDAPAVIEKRRALEKRAGLKAGLILNDGKNVQFDITLNVVKRCKAGDVDAIDLDIAHSKVKQLLLTVEGITSSDKFAPLVYKVSPEQMHSGFTQKFEIPVMQGTKTVGIYFCKDSKKEGHCADKSPADFNQLFQDYALNHYASDWLEAPDRLYAFQFVQIRNGTEVAAFQNGNVSKDEFAALPEFLRFEAPAADGARANETADRIKTLTSKVGSLPVDFGLHVSFNLPVFDYPSCEVPKTLPNKK